MLWDTKNFTTLKKGPPRPYDCELFVCETWFSFTVCALFHACERKCDKTRVSFLVTNLEILSQAFSMLLKIVLCFGVIVM